MAKISLAEPVSALRSVRIVENGEPMVDFLQFDPELRLDRPRFKYRRQTLLRQSVAKRLSAANESLLRKGYRIHVIEGWRSPEIQIRMYRAIEARFRGSHPEWSEAKLRRVVNQFSAPMSSSVPPPHTTGGAMDVMLYTRDGVELPMQSPFDRLDESSFPFAAPGLSVESRRHRDLLGLALTDAGITNYPSEYWHWSYGDQGWAYRGGHPFAHYGAVGLPDEVTQELPPEDALSMVE